MIRKNPRTFLRTMNETIRSMEAAGSMERTTARNPWATVQSKGVSRFPQQQICKMCWEVDGEVEDLGLKSCLRLGEKAGGGCWVKKFCSQSQGNGLYCVWIAAPGL